MHDQMIIFYNIDMYDFKQVDVTLPYQNYKLCLTREFKITALSSVHGNATLHT